MAYKRKGGWGGRRNGSGAKPKLVVDNAPTKAPAQPAQAAPRIGLDRLMEMIEASQAAAKKRPRTLDWCPYRIEGKTPLRFLHPAAAMPPREQRMAFDQDLVSQNGWAQNQWMQGGLLGAVASEGLFFLGYPMLSEMAQRPEFRVISETIATEMTRKGWVWKGTGQRDEEKRDKGDEKAAARIAAKKKPNGPASRATKPGDDDKSKRIRELRDMEKHLQLRDRFCDAALYDGLMGRGHLYLDSGDEKDDELKMPLIDPAAMTSAQAMREALQAKVGPGWLKRVANVEALWVYPLNYNASNPLALDWYNPQRWYVMGREIHRSRIPTFVGRPVPDLLKPAYSFGGLSLSQMAKPYVDIWIRTRESVADLVQSFATMVLLTDLQTTLQPGSVGGGGADLVARVLGFTMTRDNQGVFVANKDSEDVKSVSHPISGLQELKSSAHEDIMCCEAGTLVETDRGPVPIEKVTIKDRVMTRTGLAPLRWAGQTGMASELVEIRAGDSVLRVTGWHPIWSETTREFVSAQNVDHSHRLLAVKRGAPGNMAPRSLGADAGGGEPNGATTTTRELAAAFIAKSTKLTSALFRKALTFITSTKTLPTIAFQTSSFSPARITQATISSRTAGSTSTASSRKRSSARFVATPSRPFCRNGNFIAPRPAIAPLSESVAVASVRVIERQLQSVYNLEVAEGFLPEFFANGILVHNSIARIPAVKFTGMQPQGLNATSEGELQAFNETIGAYQVKLFDPLLTYVSWVMNLSLWDEIDEDITHEYVPLKSLSEKEEAELQKLKAETGQIVIDSGAIWQEEERQRIANDPRSGYDDIDPEDVPDLLEEEAEGLEPEGGKPQPIAQGGEGGGQGRKVVPFRGTGDLALDEAMPAAGVAFVTPLNHALFLRWAPGHPRAGEWAFPGGSVEARERPRDAAMREVGEETGWQLSDDDYLPLLNRNADHGADYWTFSHPIQNPFQPKLSNEHDAFEWRPMADPPAPLHPGVEHLLRAGYMPTGQTGEKGK